MLIFAIFADGTSFRTKRLQPKFRNRNFTSIFADQISLRAKKCAGSSKIVILLQFLPIDPNFVRKDRRRGY